MRQSCERLTQLVSLHLSHGVAWNGIEKTIRARAFVRRQVSFGSGTQPLFKSSWVFPHSWNDEGGDALAQVRVRHAGDRTFRHSGFSLQYYFDFSGGDVGATDDNQFFDATENRQITISRKRTKVASAEPPVMKSRGRGLRILPVSTEDVRAAYPDLASLALRQPLLCLRIKDPYLYTRKRQTHAAGLLYSIQGIGGIDRGLRESVTLDRCEAEPFLKTAEGLRRERRRTTGEQTHGTE